MYGHIKSYDTTNNNFDMYVAIRDKDKCNTQNNTYQFKYCDRTIIKLNIMSEINIAISLVDVANQLNTPTEYNGWRLISSLKHII